MAETLVRFEAPLFSGTDGPYHAQACGRQGQDGLWEGWIEFIRASDNKALRTGRETTQPNREDLVYWATGLRPVYLEGAFARTAARTPVTVEAPSPPVFDGPANHAPVAAGFRDSILDPFSVYAKDPAVLAQELRAFRDWQLRRVIRDYELVDETAVAIDAMPAPELAALILRRVRELSGAGLRS